MFGINFLKSRTPNNPNPTKHSVNYDSLQDIDVKKYDTIKELQHLKRTNPIARTAAETWAKNVDGGSWEVVAEYEEKQKDNFLKIKKQWREFCSACETTSKINLDLLINNMCVDRFVDGESFLLMKVVKKKLKLQKLPALRIPEKLTDSEYPVLTNKLKQNTNVVRIFKGIGFNQSDEPIKIYFLSQKNRDDEALSLENIKAFSTKNIIHFYLPRNNEVRGESMLQNISESISLYNSYIKEMLKAKNRIANLLPVIKFNAPAAQAYAQASGEDFSDLSDSFDELQIGGKTETQNKGKGASIKMPSFVDFDVVDFQKINVDDSQFLNNICKVHAMGANLSFAELYRDFSGANYSSARMESKQLQQSYKKERELIKSQILKPIFEKFKEVAILNSDLSDDDFADISFEFVADKFVEVDPQKQDQAYSIQLDNKTISPQMICAEKGLNYEQVIQDLKTHSEQLKLFEV